MSTEPVVVETVQRDQTFGAYLSGKVAHEDVVESHGVLEVQVEDVAALVRLIAQMADADPLQRLSGQQSQERLAYDRLRALMAQVLGVRHARPFLKEAA